MTVITDNLDASVAHLVAHLRWRPEYRERIRSTNLLERTFVEVRRGTGVIGRFRGETAPSASSGSCSSSPAAAGAASS